MLRSLSTTPMMHRSAAAMALLLFAVGKLASQDAQPVNPLRPAAAAPVTDKLPWEKDAAKKSPPVLRPIAGPREFLARYGIVASQWDGLLDGQPLSAAEEELVIRLLNLYSRFGQENVESWALGDLTPDRLTATPAEQRGKIVRLTGSVRRAFRVSLLPEAATRNEFAAYYQVLVQLESRQTATFYCRDIPAAWKLDTEMNEHAAAYGLFLKVGDAEGGSPLLLVTDRVTWLPREPRPELNVSSAHVSLAALGVDIGRLHAVGQERRAGITAVDREPFYQILAAATDPAAPQLLAAGPPTLDLPALLQAPLQHTGEVHPVHGIARRVLRVDVPDVDIRRRFGIDHYYEVDLSLPLPTKIKLSADPKAKGQSVMYETGFPATICVRELPPGLPIGDDVRQAIEARAVFLKLWLYQAGYTKEAGLDQPAPLFLARDVKLALEAQPSHFWSDVVVGVAMALVALIFVGIVLWFRWTDRSARAPSATMPAPKPDFSDLK